MPREHSPDSLRGWAPHPSGPGAYVFYGAIVGHGAPRLYAVTVRDGGVAVVGDRAYTLVDDLMHGLWQSIAPPEKSAALEVVAASRLTRLRTFLRDSRVAGMTVEAALALVDLHPGSRLGYRDGEADRRVLRALVLEQWAALGEIAKDDRGVWSFTQR